MMRLKSFKSCVARALFKMRGEMCDSGMVMMLD